MIPINCNWIISTCALSILCKKTMQFLMCILLLLECIVGATTQHIKHCHNFSSFLFRIKSWWSRALTCILMQNAAIVFFLCAKIIYKPRERDMFALLIYTPFVEFALCVLLWFHPKKWYFQFWWFLYQCKHDMESKYFKTTLETIASVYFSSKFAILQMEIMLELVLGVYHNYW